MKNTLETLRKENGISQEELADAVCSLENGRYNPSIFLAFRLADFFKVKIEDIFLYEGE